MTVCVVGSLHLDVVVRASHLPQPDETVAGSSVDYVFGGKGGNQAVAAARFGSAVTFAGRVGSDSFGDTIYATLNDHGIDTSLLQKDTGASGMSVAIVDSSGDYGAVIVSAANLNIQTDEIKLPTNTELVLLQNEIPESVNLAVAAMAKTVGAVVWLNAAPARELTGDLLSLVDLLIVNRVEAEFYKPKRVTTQVLTTLGPEGVLFGGAHWPAREVDVVSTHGAGDVFVGALAARVAQGVTVQEAIPFAQLAAGWHVSTPRSERDKIAKEDLINKLENQLNP